LGAPTHTYADATDTYLHADAFSGFRFNGYAFGYSRAGCDGHTYRYTLANAHTDGYFINRSDGHTHTCHDIAPHITSDSRSNGYTFGCSRAGCGGHACRCILANAHTDGQSTARGDGYANPHFNVHTSVAIYRPSIDLDGNIEVKVKRA
jgi:hypothetical protein